MAKKMLSQKMRNRIQAIVTAAKLHDFLFERRLGSITPKAGLLVGELSVMADISTARFDDLVEATDALEASNFRNVHVASTCFGYLHGLRKLQWPKTHFTDPLSSVCDKSFQVFKERFDSLNASPPSSPAQNVAAAAQVTV